MRRPGTRALGLLGGVVLLATAGTGIAYARGVVAAPATLAAGRAVATGAVRTSTVITTGATGAIGAAGAAGTATVTAAATAPAKAAALPAGAAVGPLFTGGSLSGAHSCTASVVATGAGDVLVTAAHCLSGTAAGALFAPGYAKGVAPYGTWVVQRAYVAAGWTASQDPQDDVAFLVVTPSAGSATGGSVQSVVGAQALAVTPAAGATVTVTGYAQGTGGNAIVCSAADLRTGGYPTFDCAGYVGGTSGGPWVTTAGDVVGVIGGFEQGGCVANVSYSSGFTAATQALLSRAAADGTGDTLPVAGSSGC